MEYPAGILEQVSEVIAANVVIAPEYLKFKEGFSSSPVGPPGSPPRLIDRFHVDVHYGGSVVTVLALVDESTSDLIILDDKLGLLSDEALDKAGHPAGERLVHQMSWMIKTMDDYQKELAYRNEKMRPIINILNNSIKMNYFSSYEVKTEESEVTFLVKKSLPPLEFSRLFELTECNRLNGRGENHFILKLLFKKDTGKPIPSETGIFFSKKVKLVMPDFEIPRMSRPQTWSCEDLENYLLDVADGIVRDLEQARMAWGNRANFFISIFRLHTDALKNEDVEDVINVNGYMMNVLTVPFNTDFYEALLEIILDDNFPASYPEYILTVTIEEVYSKQFCLDPKCIHKKEPFGEGWSMETMALELMGSLPATIDYAVGKITEEAAQNSSCIQQVEDTPVQED